MHFKDQQTITQMTPEDRALHIYAFMEYKASTQGRQGPFTAEERQRFTVDKEGLPVTRGFTAPDDIIVTKKPLRFTP